MNSPRIFQFDNEDILKMHQMMRPEIRNQVKDFSTTSTAASTTVNPTGTSTGTPTIPATPQRVSIHPGQADACEDISQLNYRSLTAVCCRQPYESCNTARNNQEPIPTITPTGPGTPREVRNRHDDAPKDVLQTDYQSQPTVWNPESAEIAIYELQEQNEAFEFQCNSLEEANYSLKVENSINRSTIADLQRNNAMITQTCNATAEKLCELGTAYGKSEGRNQRLQEDKRRHEALLEGVIPIVQTQKAVNEKLIGVVQEIVCHKDYAKQQLFQAVESILDTSFDVHEFNPVPKERSQLEEWSSIKPESGICEDSAESTDSDSGNVLLKSLIKRWHETYDKMEVERRQTRVANKRGRREKVTTKDFDRTFRKMAKKNPNLSQREMLIECAKMKLEELQDKRREAKSALRMLRNNQTQVNWTLDTTHAGAEKARLEDLLEDVEDNRNWLRRIMTNLKSK